MFNRNLRTDQCMDHCIVPTQRLTMTPSVSAVLLFFLILGLTAREDLDENGLKLCITSNSQIQDLSGKNFTMVPSNLPGNTQYLDMSYNALGTLTEDAFSKLRSLCFLKMADCGLKKISPHTFEKTPLLKVLNVSQNEIVIIPDLSLQYLQILDLSLNFYRNYKLPSSFQNLKSLNILALGSTYATSVLYKDFDPLQNVTLSHLILGSGTKWQAYEPGAFAKLRLLKKISLKTTFCGNLDLLQEILTDLNKTQVTAMQFVHVFPDICNVRGNPFESIQSMPWIKNLTIENTWINTSFLEGLMKDIWLSTIQDFTLVNITYNEDKPDGFQLPKQNHSFALQFITLDGINHYQYNYPIFNLRSDVFSKLTYLKFSRTGLNILPCKMFTKIPNLETLDFSDNILKENGFWWRTCSYTSIFPKLKHLFLSKNRFSSLSFITKKLHQMKLLESLDLSFNSITLDGVTHWPIWLKEINLRNNNLGNTVFNFLSSHFERINLSKTGLTVLTQKDISKFPKLTHLFLSGNGIQGIPPDLRVPTLKSLYVDQNAITSIFENDLAGLSNLQTLKAGNNPFVCSCYSFWFVASLNKSLLPDWPLQYTCSTPPSYAGKSLTAIEGLSSLSCKTWLQAVLGLAIVFVVTTISVLIFVKCDGVWYAKMLWVWMQMKRRGQKRAAMLHGAKFSYHAFISYSHHDTHWVVSQLVSCLEGAGLTLCIHERDFVPGEMVLDNIINCVDSSYKTLFILSKHFVQSQWCNYELFFAQHRSISIQQDSMVFILLEPIPADSLPKRYLRLRTILNQQTYLEWPREERKQKVFWASLKAMLHGADKFMVVKDVALGTEI